MVSSWLIPLFNRSIVELFWRKPCKMFCRWTICIQLYYFEGPDPHDSGKSPESFLEIPRRFLDTPGPIHFPEKPNFAKSHILYPPPSNVVVCLGSVMPQKGWSYTVWVLGSVVEVVRAQSGKFQILVKIGLFEAFIPRSMIDSNIVPTQPPQQRTIRIQSVRNDSIPLWHLPDEIIIQSHVLFSHILQRRYQRSQP